MNVHPVLHPCIHRLHHGEPPRESSKVMRLGTEGLGHHGICLSPHVRYWRYLTVDFGMFLSTKVIWRCLTADKIFFYQKAIRRYLTLSDGGSLVNEFVWGPARDQTDAIWRYLTRPPRSQNINRDIRRYPTRTPPPQKASRSRKQKIFFQSCDLSWNGWTLYPPDSVR